MPQHSAELAACPDGKLYPPAAATGSGSTGRALATTYFISTATSPPTAATATSAMASRKSPGSSATASTFSVRIAVGCPATARCRSPATPVSSRSSGVHRPSATSRPSTPASETAPAISTPATPRAATRASGGTGSVGPGRSAMLRCLPRREVFRPRYRGQDGGMTQPLVVVDGANVMGSRPDGWWRDRAGAARRLVSTLARGVSWPGEVVLVLEGRARAGVPEGVGDGRRVVHAPGSGDDAIVDLVRTEGRGRPVTVVTADRGLRERVTALGATVAGPRSLVG